MKKYIILASEERIRKVIFYISSERRHKKVLTISSFLRGTFLSVLLLSACFSFTSAQTMGDLPPPDNGSQCTDLKYNLTYTKSKDSNTNGEVSDLQFFLQDIGLLDSDPTGYFGKLTFNAVKAFQRQNNLYAYGYVGATTRAVIKSLSCGGGIVSTPTPPTITSVIPGDGRVTLNFTAGNSAATTGNVAVTRYGAVCISNNQVATYLDATVSPLAITVTGLPNGVLTTCQIVIVNSAGQNIQSIAAPASASFTPSASVSSCTGTVTPGNKTVVAGVSGGSVWGNGANNIFSSDSSLGSIAQFLGAKVGSTVNLIVADAGCKSTFGGSVTQSGVTTVSYTSPWRGMTVTLGSCLSNCASTAAAPTVSWSPSSSTITSGQSNPAYSYTSVGQTRNCVIYDPSTATASYPGTVLWNSVEATHTFPAGLLGTITQNLSRKLVCFNDSGVGSTPATYTITVANSATPTIIITSPQPNANFKIGDNIPISWTYSGVPRNSQVVYSITGINTTGSGVEGGTGQSNELSVNSTSGSAVWRTGGNGYLNVPGTYAVSATINECNPSGCSYAPSGKILSTVQNSVRITIDSPSTVVTTPTLNSFNVVTSTSGTVRKDETFSMNWSGSNATRFEYNVNYGTAYTTIGGNSWSGSLALDPTVTPGSTYTMGLRACNASNVCSSTVYRPLVVTAATVTTAASLNLSINGSPVSNGQSLTVSNASVSWSSNASFCMVDGIVQTGTSGSKVLSVGQHVITCANSTGTSVISAYVTYTPIAMNLDVGSQVLGVSTICTNIPRNLHRGAESNSVKNLQTFLQDKGLLTDAPTGFYGDKTVEAVKDYQAMKGLPQTGMVYDFTRQAIKTESCR